MAAMNDGQRVRLVPLGGLGEFGLNAMVVEWDEHLPGWELSRYGPVLFGMIALGLLVAPSRRLQP